MSFRKTCSPGGAWGLAAFGLSLVLFVAFSCVGCDMGFDSVEKLPETWTEERTEDCPEDFFCSLSDDRSSVTVSYAGESKHLHFPDEISFLPSIVSVTLSMPSDGEILVLVKGLSEEPFPAYRFRRR